MADFTWVGRSGAYLDPNQWRNADTGAGPPAGPPGLADIGTIDDNGTAIVAGVLAGLGSGQVGAQGNGSLLVQGGGALLIANDSLGLDLGVALGAAGTLGVSGGSRVAINGPLEVGDHGTGDLAIQTGGTVIAGSSGAGTFAGDIAVAVQSMAA